MPIYEFYCPDCHTIFSFLARRMGTRKRPACPRCTCPRLERRASAFAVSRGLPAPDDAGPGPELDESRVEQAMGALAEQAESIGEDDPRAMARLMHRFYEKVGVPLGQGMQEALRRMEDGEDPDRIEEELGDVLEREEPLLAAEGGSLRALRRRVRPPRVDPTLYEL